MEAILIKLTGILKDKVDAVETKDENNAIIAETGMELTDEELDGVAGGIAMSYENIACPMCGYLNFVNVKKIKFTCECCKSNIEFK